MNGCNKYGRYINFFCLFSMFVILPLVSIVYSAINWKGHFTSDNIMAAWNLTYVLQNVGLILTYFIIAKEFIYEVRSNLLGRDKDVWVKHVDEIVHYIKEDGEFAEVEDIEDYDPNTWKGFILKWTIGDPQPDQILKPSIHDVTESAAIYRVFRSFERKKSNLEQLKPMDKDNWFAKSS